MSRYERSDRSNRRQGTKGATGADDTTGVTGATGTNDTNGAAGATGANGTTGPVGATGPTGAHGLSQYAYVYNLRAETIGREEAGPFDHNGILSAGITHAAGTAAITHGGSGIYQVTFSVSGTQPTTSSMMSSTVTTPTTRPYVEAFASWTADARHSPSGPS